MVESHDVHHLVLHVAHEVRAVGDRDLAGRSVRQRAREINNLQHQLDGSKFDKFVTPITMQSGYSIGKSALCSIVIWPCNQ